MIVKPLRLDDVLKPDPLPGALDVSKLVAGGPAVDLAERGHRDCRVRRRGSWRSADHRRRQATEVILGESIRGKLERRVARRRRSERIELGGQVAVGANRPGEVRRSDDLVHGDRGQRRRSFLGGPGMRSGPGAEPGAHVGGDRFRLAKVALVLLDDVAGVEAEKFFQVTRLFCLGRGVHCTLLYR